MKKKAKLTHFEKNRIEQDDHRREKFIESNIFNNGKRQHTRSKITNTFKISLNYLHGDPELEFYFLSVFIFKAVYDFYYRE
jgi:hypothetical protein